MLSLVVEEIQNSVKESQNNGVSGIRECFIQVVKKITSAVLMSINSVIIKKQIGDQNESIIL